jgi:hypothetical protein
MSVNLVMKMQNTKAKIIDADLKLIESLVTTKYACNDVTIEIKEVLSHERTNTAVSRDILNALNTMKMHVIDYLGRFSLDNVCTSRGDNRLLDTQGRVFYVVESHFATKSNKLTLTVIGTEAVIGLLSHEEERVLNSTLDVPAYILRIIRSSLAFARKDNRCQVS